MHLAGFCQVFSDPDFLQASAENEQKELTRKDWDGSRSFGFHLSNTGIFYVQGGSPWCS